jgi:hypothetical protein
VQLVGGLACGPKTANVIVPVAPLTAPVSLAFTVDAAIAVPTVPVLGAVAVIVVVLVTDVDGMLLPQPLLDAGFALSPL